MHVSVVAAAICVGCLARAHADVLQHIIAVVFDQAGDMLVGVVCHMTGRAGCNTSDGFIS